MNADERRIWGSLCTNLPWKQSQRPWCFYWYRKGCIMENIVISMGQGNFLSINKIDLICYGKSSCVYFINALRHSWPERNLTVGHALWKHLSCKGSVTDWPLDSKCGPWSFFSYVWFCRRRFGVIWYLPFCCLGCEIEILEHTFIINGHWWHNELSMLKGICWTSGFMGGFDLYKSMGSYLKDQSTNIAHHMQEVFVQSALIICWDLVLGAIMQTSGFHWIYRSNVEVVFLGIIPCLEHRTEALAIHEWGLRNEREEVCVLTSQGHFIFATITGGHTLFYRTWGLLLPHGRYPTCHVHPLETICFWEGWVSWYYTISTYTFHQGITFSIIWVWGSSQTDSLTFGDQAHGQPLQLRSQRPQTLGISLGTAWLKPSKRYKSSGTFNKYPIWEEWCFRKHKADMEREF